MYFINVMENALNKSFFGKRDNYRHFEAIEGVFYNTCEQYYLSSTNGFAVELDRLPKEFRITRFIRDPRDLIVSGYYYHKRGAEPWFRMKNPTNKYWEPINGNVPVNQNADQSYSEYLSDLSIEDGLIAELEFRKFHLESFRNWPEDERIKIFKYEDILHNEEVVFEELTDHLQFSRARKKVILKYARQYAYNAQNKKSSHIRNPKPSQWKDVFTEKVLTEFNESYSDILERHGYEI
jgi:hypothetical protein